MADQETQYKVKADLVLDATRANQQAVQARRRIHELGQRISGANNLAGGLTRRLIAVGAAYIGINTLTRAFTGLTHSATQYAAELEKTQIGLTSVLAAVMGAEWDVAAKTSGRVFEQMRQDSIKSVATAQQLFTLYQGIVGPIARAGFGLETVRNMTLSAVNASGVLGVDLQQAQRDMSLMVRGAAGMDVKLFSLLRSTGAIKETTEEWNKSLTASERVEKLQAALDKFAPAGERFAKSWAGVTSTFKGIRQEFTRSAWQPIMNTMARALGRINDRLIANQDVIQERLRAWGEQTAAKLDRVFMRAEAGVAMLIDRWDEILERGRKLQELAGLAGKAVAIGAGIQAVRPVAGMAVSGVGTLAGMFAGQGVAAATTGAAGAAGAGAAGAAGAGALAAVGPALAVAAGAAGIFTSAILVVREQWDRFAAMFTTFRPVLLGLWEDTVGFAAALWDGLAPILKVVGHLMGPPLVASFVNMVAGLRVLFRFGKAFAESVARITKGIYEALRPVFDALWAMVDRFTTFVTESVDWITGDVAKARALLAPVSEEDPLKELAKRFAPGTYKPPWHPDKVAEQMAMAPTGRTTVVNDFRGSKIQVKQDFRDQDPDRVLLSMVQEIQRQAEMPIQSGLMPAVAR